MFSALRFKMEHKKAVENRTAVYFVLHLEFYNFFSSFGAFLLLLSLVSIKKNSGVQKYVWKDVIHTVILVFFKKNWDTWGLAQVKSNSE